LLASTPARGQRYPIWCVSRRVELLEALKVVTSEQKPLVYAEVGVYTGHFSQRVWKYIRPHTMFLMDLWENTHGEEYMGSIFTKRTDGTTFQVYRSTNMKIVANAFKDQVAAGLVTLIKGKSVDTIPHLANHSVDIAYIDSLHDYATPAQELALMSTKMKPTGLLCGHDYTHAAGSHYYNGIKKQDQGDAYNAYGVIEAVNEFLMFNPAWFLVLKTSVGTQRSHTSYCLAQYAHFPHWKYIGIQAACKEDQTLEKAAAAKGEAIDLSKTYPVLD